MKYLMLILLLVFSACQQFICNKPYIMVGADCCLDIDDNKVCDKDETAMPEEKVTIIEQPKIIVNEPEKEEQLFLCWDGSRVSDAYNCPEKPKEAEVNIPTLVDTNEIGSVITGVNIRPACVEGINGGEIYYKVGTVPTTLYVEAMELGGTFQELFKRGGLYDGYIYFPICESCQKGSFSLKPGKMYIVRMKFDQLKVWGRIEYSNEHLVDTRNGSTYLSKNCGKR